MGQLLALAQSVMTNVGVAGADTASGVVGPRNRKGIRRPQRESSALAFQRTPSISAAAATLLSELREMPNVRVHRPAILYGVLKALRGASAGNVPLAEAARRVREEEPIAGPPIAQACGWQHAVAQRLEAEVAVVLNTEA